MPSRLLRHFAPLMLPPTSESIMRGIFSAILGGFMDLHFAPGEGLPLWSAQAHSHPHALAACSLQP
jgi:hypothetical protein